MLGTLYGIGVGPGDPELLTLKAVRILKEVSHVFTAASSKNDYSVAFDIVRDHLHADTPVDKLNFPMTFNPESLENAWRDNCRKVVQVLEEGKDAAFLTIGDPLTFSTFIYLMRKIRHRLPNAPITVVPGITSFQAAAASANVPLAEGEETITIISGAKGGERFREAVHASENLVLMKTYKHFQDILGEIKDAGLEKNCCFVSRCGQNGQMVETDFDKLQGMEQPHYLSLMIVKKRGLEA